jgi:hypothetical protein
LKAICVTPLEKQWYFRGGMSASYEPCAPTLCSLIYDTEIYPDIIDVVICSG